MSDEPDDRVPPGRLRTMQIIAGALVLGLAVFLGIVVFLVQVQNQGRPLGQAQGAPVMSILALGMLAVLAVMSVVLPDVMMRQYVRGTARGHFPSPQSDADWLLGLRQTTLILSLALLEGPAFFCCIAYLLEGRFYTLGGALLAILLMGSRFPTEAGLRAWLRRQLDALDAQRGGGDPDGPP